MKLQESFTFDDVLIRPAASSVLPTEASTSTYFSKTIKINIPIVSSAMDTVTEAKLAIAIAQNGGIGVIHKNNSIEKQVEEVIKVKKYESGMVIDPITVGPDNTLQDVKNLKSKYHISGFPVIDKNNKVVGIITNRDVRFAENPRQKVKELMTTNQLIIAKEGIQSQDALSLLHKHKIEKLIVVNKNMNCVGLITVTDIEKSEKHPLATKDSKGRLRVAAAIGVGNPGIERAKKLVEAGVDAVVIDTAHGHSFHVIDIVRKLKKILKNRTQIIAGNIATYEAGIALIAAGVDGVKVGIGPGSICTTRIVAGVGVPQFSAILEVAKACKNKKIPLIADGGIRYSGDIAKAIGAGADSIMVGSLLAGTAESPGDVFLYQGRSYKSYRGMGSLGAMASGSADRYFQQEVEEKLKYVPEGVEGRVPFKGPVSDIIFQLVGGLRASMGYTGNKDIRSMKKKCVFQKITSAGVKESHIHDISVTREAPNYKSDL